MNGKLTEMVFILDRSGSMGGKEEDTIGGFNSLIEKQKKEDIPARTVFIITTDGLENASTKYTAEKVRQMVSLEQEKYGWEFLFLGANIDAVETARTYGLKEGHAVRFHNDKKGIGLNYAIISETVASIRKGCMVEEDWCAEIAEDFKARQK